MAVDLGTLQAHIKLDGAEGVKTSLANITEKVNETAEKFGIQLPEGFNTAALAAGAITTAVVAVGKALWDCANEVAEYGDAIDKNSQKMGISASAYQEWAYVLERNGSDISVLQKGMKTLNKQIDAGSEAFDTLGVSLTDANGNLRSSEDIMNDALYALAGMEDGAERTALASELFGDKVAQELNPMLNSGAESMDELRNRVNELGGVMSDEGVANSAEFEDAMTDLDIAFRGIKNTIGTAVLPILTKLINFIANVVSSVGKAVSAIGSAISSAIGFMGSLASSVGSAIGSIVSWFSGLPGRISGALSSFSSSVSSTINSVIGWFAGLPGSISSALGNLGGLLWGAGSSIMSGFFDGIKSKYYEIQDYIGGIGGWIKQHKGPEDYDKNLLVENGMWIMGGLEKGLKNGIPSLRNTLTDISGTIAGTNFTASTSLIGAGAGNVYNVYFNGTRVNDDAQIENKMVELLTLMARKGIM